jgi:hypothetical protein
MGSTLCHIGVLDFDVNVAKLHLLHLVSKLTCKTELQSLTDCRTKASRRSILPLNYSPSLSNEFNVIPSSIIKEHTLSNNFGISFSLGSYLI